MAEYNFSFKFDIDANELNGLSRVECFVLGFEFSQVCNAIRNVAEGADPDNLPIHARNTARIRAFARREKVAIWLSPVVDGWRELRFVEEDEDDEGDGDFPLDATPKFPPGSLSLTDD